MTFSKEWDEKYRADEQMSIWPWSDLVSSVMRYASPAGPGCRVLELGCGAGANIPFFRHLGVDYYALEGSPAIVERLKRRFPDMKERIIAGDFTREIPFAGEFDLVVDRSSLTHNSTSSIRRCLTLVRAKLRPGGKYIGIDWFSTLHSDYPKGLEDEDAFTRSGFTDGQFAGIGKVHFTDQAHLLDLFYDFKVVKMEHKIVRQEVPPGDHVFAAWNLAAVKPE